MRWVAFLAAALLMACAAPAVRAEEEPQDIEASGRKLVTPEAQRGIERGLAWLASRQHDDGAFGSARFPRNVAVTGLAGMAFMAGGHAPGRGKYGDQVSRTVDYILSRARSDGFIIDVKSASHGPMYGHGFATLFLAEVYGMSPKEEVRTALERAVKLIVNTQNKEGGWRYEPVPRDADISVTVCQIMALRAARNAGIHVPKATVDKTIEYIRKCQNPDGGFRYQLTGQPESLFPRSAAALVALYSAGVYEGREIERGLAYVMRHTPQGGLFRESHYFYGHYYAVQATWHAGGDYWLRWYPAIRDELLLRQIPDGSWPDHTTCSEYGTAMACLVLQMPNNYLPIFQR